MIAAGAAMREQPLVPDVSALSFDFDSHRYHLDGRELTSVTKILGILDKPALPWWGMEVGIAGLLQLIDLVGLEVVDLDPKRISALLTVHKLTVNHVRDNAGARGSTAHKQLERFGREGQAITVAGVEEDVRGYVRAAARFVLEERPRFLANEVMVYSGAHHYAGTFDALLTCESRAGLGVVDYKTSKRVYDSHGLQLAAYEGARREHGCRPADWGAVVLLQPDGGYVLEPVDIGIEAHQEFLQVKGAFDALEQRKARLKAWKKATTEVSK